MRPYPSVGGSGVKLLRVRGGAILRNRCGRGAPRQRHERVLLDPAAEVSGLGVAHNLTPVADRPQAAGDEFVERRLFPAGDLDDAVSRRRERRLGNDGSNVVRRDGLEQAGRNPDYVSIRT